MGENAVTLAVLAGGEGSRMGKPKGLLTVGERPILRYLLDRLAWEGPTMLVTSPGRERPQGADAFHREVTDPVAGMGPLRGVLTAIEQSDTGAVVVVTVDMPCVLRGQLDLLVSVVAADDRVAGAMYRRGDVDVIEPFPSVLKRRMERDIAERVAAGAGSVQALGRREDFRLVTPRPAWGTATWTNLNRPADYQAFVASLGA